MGESDKPVLMGSQVVGSIVDLDSYQRADISRRIRAEDHDCKFRQAIILHKREMEAARSFAEESKANIKLWSLVAAE